MSKTKEFITKRITVFCTLLKNAGHIDIFNLAFWCKGWKRIVTIAGVVAINTLIIVLVINGQRDIGAQEAGRQIYNLAQNIRHHYQARPNFWGLSTQYVVQNKLYPTDMRFDGNNLVGYFGNKVIVGGGADGTPVMPSVKQFVIVYKDLSKLQCIGFISNKFNNDFWLGIRRVSLNNEYKTYNFGWTKDTYILPVPKSTANKLCSNNNNSIVFHFE
jgi:hypothetical protein